MGIYIVVKNSFNRNIKGGLDINRKKQFPILKNQTILHKGLKYSFLYQNRKIGSKSILINRDDARIIDECDGKSSLDQIVKRLANKYGEDPEILIERVETFFSSNDYFNIMDKPTSKKTIKSGKWNIQLPDQVSIELTSQCNFKCKHCIKKRVYQENSYIDGKGLLNILEDLKSSGVDIIELSGGEPLTHPKFVQILEHSLDLFSMVSIVTNGYLINKDILKLFYKYKDKIELQIGLYGNKQSYVDWFSGKQGAFKRSKLAIELASNEGISVTSSMIVTPLNLCELISTVQLSKKLGASSFRVSIVGTANGDQLHFSPGKIKFLSDEISAAKEIFGDFISETPEYLLKNNEKISYCDICAKTMTITSNGDLKICPIATTPQLYIGNLHTEDINSLISRVGDSI